MRVLVAHNRYRSASPSGENTVVDAECDLLADSGVDVVRCFAESDSLLSATPARRVAAAVGPLYAPDGVPRVRRLLASTKPDVLHVHNVFPLLSPWIVRTAHAAGVPVVQTVHNYRHSCVNGLHVRDGRRCDDCFGRAVPWPAVAHACYRGSRLQSVPMAASQVVHRGTWQLVDHFLALTPFMVERLRATGLPADRVSLRPTWVPDPGPSPLVGRDLAFVGRLDEAKGVGLLLDAWRARPAAGRTLVVAGDGPMLADVLAAAATTSSIRYVGRLDRPGVVAVMRAAAAVVLPSVFYEGFPLTMAEAFAVGRPVIVPEGGSAASVVTDDCGWVAPLSSAGLGMVMNGLTDDELVRRGAGARRYYERRLHPSVGASSLLAVYDALRTGRPAA